MQKIESSAGAYFFIEALLRSYHLNLELLCFIMHNARQDYQTEGKKPRQILKEMAREMDVNETLKGFINKKTFKLVKTWMSKMDDYYKTLRVSEPSNTKQLFHESQKIFSLLNISLIKLSARKHI